MAYLLQVSADHAEPVPVGSAGTTLSLVDGATVYYGDTTQTSASLNNGSLSAGSVTITDTPLFIRSASYSTVSVSVVDTQGLVQVPPSGGDDTPELNAKLALGGYVRGRPGATYLISSPVVIPSNTTLDMTGCTISFLNTSVQTNMLQNAAVQPVASATDASTTAGSSVVTSPTLAARAVVGQQLGVVGAGPAGGDGGGAIWLYGTVASIAGNNITLTSTNVNGIAATNTLASATAYLFNRDSNIRVIGGTWNQGTNWNGAGSIRNAGGANTHIMRFRRVDGLTVRKVRVQAINFPLGGGWCFGVSPGDVTDLLAEDITGIGASTCFQADGPLTRAIVRNVRGQTQDDMVAFGCVAFQGNDTEGDITDVLVDGIEAGGPTAGAAAAGAANSYTALKLFGGTGANGVQRVISGVKVRGVKGFTQQHGVIINEYAGPTTVDADIDDVTVATGSNAGVQYPAVYISASNGNVNLSNIKWPKWAVGPPNSGIIQTGRPMNGSLTIQGVDFRASTGNGICLYITEAGGTGGKYYLVRLTGVNQPDTGMAQCYLAQVNTAAVIDRFEISDFRKAAPGPIMWNQGPANISDISMSRGRHDGNSTTQNDIYVAGSSTNAMTLRLSDLYVRNTNQVAISTSHPLTVYADNCEFSVSFAVCFANGANATPIRFLGTNLRMSGTSAALLARSAAQSLSLSSHQGTVDQTILTPQDGDIFYNSNATPLNGVGLAIYNSAAAKIKNIYSGTTN